MITVEQRGAAGFTLIELLVTLAIISVLASMTFPLAETSIRRTKEQDLKYALRQLREGIDAYKRAVDEGRISRPSDQSGYPKSLEALKEGIIDERDPKRRKMYFIRDIPRDPFAVDTSSSAAATWGQRSYASSHDEPKEGADIYDIYSLSSLTGLNGIPYKQW
jgi:general secretion pathway protein G